MKRSTFISAIAIVSGIFFVAGLAVTIAAANNVIAVTDPQASTAATVTFSGFAGVAFALLLSAIEHRPAKQVVS